MFGYAHAQQAALVSSAPGLAPAMLHTRTVADHDLHETMRVAGGLFHQRHLRPGRNDYQHMLKPASERADAHRLAVRARRHMGDDAGFQQERVDGGERLSRQRDGGAEVRLGQRRRLGLAEVRHPNVRRPGDCAGFVHGVGSLLFRCDTRRLVPAADVGVPPRFAAMLRQADVGDGLAIAPPPAPGRVAGPILVQQPLRKRLGVSRRSRHSLRPRAGAPANCRRSAQCARRRARGRDPAPRSSAGADSASPAARRCPRCGRR